MFSNIDEYYYSVRSTRQVSFISKFNLRLIYATINSWSRLHAKYGMTLSTIVFHSFLLKTNTNYEQRRLLVHLWMIYKYWDYLVTWCYFSEHPQMVNFFKCKSHRLLAPDVGETAWNISFCWKGNSFLGGAFKYVSFSPRNLGKIPILTSIFFKGVETTNYFFFSVFHWSLATLRWWPPALWYRWVRCFWSGVGSCPETFQKKNMAGKIQY